MKFHRYSVIAYDLNGDPVKELATTWTKKGGEKIASRFHALMVPGAKALYRIKVERKKS